MKALDAISPGTGSASAKELLRVVIAYNDLTAAKRAIHVLASLDQGLGDAIEFQPLPWAFDILMDADWREAALGDAIKADMVIIATSAPGPLPLAMEWWIELIVSRKRGTEAAIVALFGSEDNPDDMGSPRLVGVREAAQRVGLDFFAPAALEELCESEGFIRRRVDVSASIIREALPSLRPPPRWGINE